MTDNNEFRHLVSALGDEGCEKTIKYLRSKREAEVKALLNAPDETNIIFRCKGRLSMLDELITHLKDRRKRVDMLDKLSQP